MFLCDNTVSVAVTTVLLCDATVIFSEVDDCCPMMFLSDSFPALGVELAGTGREQLAACRPVPVPEGCGGELDGVWLSTVMDVSYLSLESWI